MSESSQNRSDMDEWDSVFEDSDPTRVLDPRTFGQDSGKDPVSPPAEAGLSATRYQRTSPAQVHRDPSPLQGQEVPQAGASYQPTQPYQQVEQVAPTRSLSTVGDSPYSSAAPSAVASSASALKRVQFIPAFCGALVAYALASAGLALARTLMGVLGISTYSGLTETVLAVTAPASRSQALPWLITVAVLLSLAFGLAGYTASRMTGLAPSKQALGVLAVTVLGSLLATLLTWATAQLSHPLAPSYALQPLLSPDLPIGALTALAAGLLALLAALAGAGFGLRYHRALAGTDLRSR